MKLIFPLSDAIVCGWQEKQQKPAEEGSCLSNEGNWVIDLLIYHWMGLVKGTLGCIDFFKVSDLPLL